MNFSRKSKNTMAQIFEQFIHSGVMSLIKDERQKQQILSVSNELKAPDTPLGHGDAFFSIALALQSVHDTAYKFDFSTVTSRVIAGQIIAISFDSTNSHLDTVATIVFKFDGNKPLGASE